jgi:hypothetical protein
MIFSALEKVMLLGQEVEANGGNFGRKVGGKIFVGHYARQIIG